ncbi:MAG: DUF3016 domain-containing protein [Janthinobacterium lividum]
MKSMIGKAALATVLALGASAASAGVTVNYVNPENFSDLPFSPWHRQVVLEDLAGYFAQLGKDLPAGQELKVDVTNIDLAGRQRPGRGAKYPRFAQGGADWPVIELRYTLSANGKVVDSGTAQLKDMAYLDHLDSGSNIDRLRFEKRMVQEWFNETILPKTFI